MTIPNIKNMKKIGLLLFSLYSFSIITLSQDTTTIFLNKIWRPTKQEKAKYIQQDIKLDNDEYVTIKMTIDKIPISICHYKSIKPFIEHGKVQYFDTDGKMTISGSYDNGNMDDIWYIYDSENNNYDTLNYNGILELYEDDDTEFPFPEVFFIVENMPKFGQVEKDGKEEFRTYVSQNLHYPIRAQQNEIEGKIFIQFIVGPDGKVYMPKAVVKGDKDLTFEALRVIRDSPLWIPGKQRNREVAVQYTMPIIFILN